MRFDNRRSTCRTVSSTLFATVLTLGACRPSAPGSTADDSARAAPRADSAPASSAAAPSRADSVVLRTDKSQYRAGEKITLTFENKGARSYAFNPCSRTLEREENGTWTTVAEPNRMCTMEAWILDPHGTRTGPTELPSSLPAGRYRVVVRMTMDALGSAPAGAVNAVSDPITVS
jgi:hypothetical protein